MSDKSIASHRDASYLTRALGQSLEPASDACLDAEALAAWSEGRLSGDTLTQAEHHLSTCARCQELLAVFANAEPQAAAVVIPFWSRRAVRWIVPATAAAAAAVLVWMVVPFRDADRPASTSMARVEPQAAPAPPPAVAPPPTPLAERVEKPLAKELADDAKLESRARPGGSSEQKNAAAVRSDAPRPPAVGEPARDASMDRAAATAPPAPAEVPSVPTPRSAPPPPAAAPPMAPSPRAAEGAVGQAKAGAAAQAEQSRFADASAKPAAEATSSLQRVAAPAVVIYVTPVAVVIDRAVPAPAGNVAGRGGRAGATAPAPAPPPPPPMAPPAPLPIPRWRISDGTRVERTEDGVSWQSATIQSPGPLTAGFAPSALVCWLVGPNGAVFRAMDGITFDRRPFPESAALVSVRATADGQQATVTAADGRQFTTTNGGASWTQTK